MSIVSQNFDTNLVPVTSHLVQFNHTSQLPLKLTGSHNFATWKAQIEMLLHGHDLYGFLDGTHPAPPNTIIDKDKETPNPAFKLWFRQDKLIQNALLASVDPTLASTVATADSAKSAFESLHTAFANKSQTRIFSLCDQLARVTKDNRSVAEYLRNIRSLADELATAGSLVTNAELVVKILSGLGKEFYTIAGAIRARESPISYEELYEKLLDHELFLKHAEHSQAPPLITAAVA